MEKTKAALLLFVVSFVAECLLFSMRHDVYMCMFCIDRTRGFIKDQLKGKKLLQTFQTDALVVVFRALAL